MNEKVVTPDIVHFTFLITTNDISTKCLHYRRKPEVEFWVKLWDIVGVT